ncbi:MAG: deoxyribose-phosphate aldolase [Clostridioides sp.]|jgi:deoxyribose-phosphate aldolase|nr:deoxyribose-phosphate aldolase [Clostridioides sp.]
MKKITEIIDYTYLKPFARWEDIKSLCDSAKSANVASVCIPPTYVKRAVDYLDGAVPVCTVIGFPLGYQKTDLKIKEAELAVSDGVSELDMVVNIGDLKDKRYDVIENEIRSLKKVAGERILKVIIETCYLNDEEKIIMCDLIIKAGADFVKTSTGFGDAGATVHDVELLYRHSEGKIRVKASGGIRTGAQALELMKAGAQRIGSSVLLED